MASKLLVVLLLFLVAVPAYGVPLSDKTGFVNKLDVKTDGHTFQIETVTNFDVDRVELNKDQKRLTLYTFSSIENNFGEMYLPQTLLSGNLTFYVNGQESFPKIKQNSDISFITFNFTGSGENKIEIIGTNYLQTINLSPIKNESIENEAPDKGGGCLIATAAYGSELAPQVQFLREIRDTKLMTTTAGVSFMTTFNSFYYLFSPTIADMERANPLFKEIVKITITPIIITLSILNHVDVDSEFEVLTYGVSLIILNIGMYFVSPALIIVTIKKKLGK